MNVIMAIDVGTSRTKVSVFDIRGTQLAASDRSAPLTSGEGIEGDPHILIHDVIELGQICLASVRTHYTNADLISVGVTGQMGSWIGVDAEGVPVTPMDSYLDSRFLSIKEKMLAQNGTEILEKTGITPFVGPKMRWWMENRPETFAKIKKAVSPSGFVVSALTGLDVESTTVDRTQVWIWGLSRTADSEWDAALIESAGIPKGILPRISEPWEVSGYLTSGIREHWGVSSRVPVVSGIGDGMAGWLGSGACAPGIAVDTSASTDHLAFTVDEFIGNSDGIISATPSVLPDIWHHQGWGPGTGRVHMWLQNEIGVTKADEDMAASLSPGSNGVMVVPHFSGRVCPDQPGLRGAVLGVGWSTQRGHIYRAFLESIAFEYLHYQQSSIALGGTPATEVRVLGGGARNRLWNQIKADVLGLPYLALEDKDYTAWGTAVVAGIGAGLWGVSDLPSITKPTVTETVVPDSSRHRSYIELAGVYLDALRDLESMIASYRKT